MHVLEGQARDAAALIVGRLADPVVVTEAVAACERNSKYPFDWGGPGLFTGHAGSALAFQAAHRAIPAEAGRWRGLAHQHLITAAQATFDVPLTHPGISAGTAGLALAFADSAVEEPRYGGTLGKLTAQLAGQVTGAPSWRAEDGVRDSSYDVITGAAGTLGYLTLDPDPVTQQAIDVLIDDLVWLCAPRETRQPWFIPPRHFPLESYRRSFPHGYVNLGLAHGIPGPLAALSFAYRAGYRRDGMLEAIRHVTDYLIDVRCEDEWGRNWPVGIPLTETGAENRDDLEPARTAWCYGAPGVASALLNASIALDDDKVRAVAVDAFEAVLRRFAGIPEATVCHGVAGLLSICVVFASETGSEAARGGVGALTEELLTHCDKGMLLGVQDHERGALLDNPSLLTGSAGVALALWSALGEGGPHWERALLIS